MADEQPLIEARDVGIYRANRWLVRHVDVKVLRGQLVYIIGANGAGKSTTAKALLGLISITEGEITRSTNVKVSYVPQRLQINPTLPLTMRRLLRLTKRYPQAEIDRALFAVGLQRLGNPLVSTLSGGEFQRLLLAQALLSQPDLLMLDEPAQGVDAAGAEKLQNVIEGIRNELGCGVLCISHDLQLAMDTGDDFLVLIPHEYDEVDAE
jgi:zinc transport system ATP-binding protein